MLGPVPSEELRVNTLAASVRSPKMSPDPMEGGEGSERIPENRRVIYGGEGSDRTALRAR